MNNWFITDYEQIQLYDGFRIEFTTNTPCHLFCYWTNKKPWVHRSAGDKRGLLLMFYQYFCFVAWTKIDQNEAGDTLFHSFTLSSWPYCETRWFVFSGEVNSIKSPSIGPIIQKHNKQPLITPSFSSTPPYKCYVGASQAWYNVDRCTEGLIKDLLPSNANVAFLHFVGASGYTNFGLKPTGSPPLTEGGVGANNHFWAFVALDNNKTFDALLHINLYQAIYIIGYGLDTSVTMFSTPLDVTPPLGDAWQVLDLSTYCPNATAILLEFSRNIDIYSYGIRPHGSTDNRIKNLGHSWYIVGCDSNQKIDVYPGQKDGRVSKVYVVGYIFNSSRFYTNSPDKSISTVGSYTPVTIAPLNSLSFMEAYTTTPISKIACRPVGSAEDIYKTPHGYRGFIIGSLDPSGRFEYKIENLSSKLYLFGTGI